MNDIITHLRNASHACTDGYECSLSIREVRHVVALLAEKDAEIARLREALEPFAALAETLPSEPRHWEFTVSAFAPGVMGNQADFTGSDLRRAVDALALLSPALEVEQFVKALESAPKPTA